MQSELETQVGALLKEKSLGMTKVQHKNVNSLIMDTIHT